MPSEENTQVNQLKKHVPEPDYLYQFLSSWDYRKKLFSLASKAIDDALLEENQIRQLAGDDQIMAELLWFLVRSKRVVQQIKVKCRIGIVFAVWKELRRLQPHTSANPHGEDSLRAKVFELNWLFKGTQCDWVLYVVDDDCPENSLEMAKQISMLEKFENVNFLRLSDALPSRSDPLSKLRCAADSVKGGAILYGMQQAERDGCDFVVYTDCDNSNNLGQLGLLLEGLVAGNCLVSLGDRRSTSVSHWQMNRESESPSNSVLKHVRGLLKFDLIIRDVTCPFKAFEGKFLRLILNGLDVFDFSFDFDIVGYLTKHQVPTLIVPVVSLDSDLETAWTLLGNSAVWQQKLRGATYIASKYDLPHRVDVAEFISEKLWTQDAILKVLSYPLPNQLMKPGAIGSEMAFPLHEVRKWMETMQA